MKLQNKKAVKPIDFTALQLFSFFFRFAQEIAHAQYNQNNLCFYFRLIAIFASLKKIMSLGNLEYHKLKFL